MKYFSDGETITDENGKHYDKIIAKSIYTEYELIPEKDMEVHLDGDGYLHREEGPAWVNSENVSAHYWYHGKMILDTSQY